MQVLPNGESLLLPVLLVIDKPAGKRSHFVPTQWFNYHQDLVDRIKRLAEQKGISMEQEVRDLLQKRYGQREQVLTRIVNGRKRYRWNQKVGYRLGNPLDDPNGD